MGFILRRVVGNKIARAHVNRLRQFDVERHAEPQDPTAGLWPDSRRVLHGILAEGASGQGFLIKHPERREIRWVAEHDLPAVAVAAYRLSVSKERAVVRAAWMAGASVDGVAG